MRSAPCWPPPSPSHSPNFLSPSPSSSSCLQTAPKIFGGNYKTHLLAFYSAEADNADALLSELKKTAKEVKGKVRS